MTRSRDNTAREMRRLSARMVEGLHRDETCVDGDVLPAMAQTLTSLRGRPVVIKRVEFPPDTASGLWLDLPDMDIIAVREGTTGPEHDAVIAGHEAWHMFQGHCEAHTPAGPTAARAQLAVHVASEELVRLVIGDPEPAGLSAQVLRSAARTHFDREHETQAETFGYRFATDLRTWRKEARRSQLGGVAGRIEGSLAKGPWA
ncbi:toxin-antitoxin system, toxin component [Streptomyces mirabilis]|uniref:toxin-antitoxin system, toxin component n=1 Tax=Streptomyces mirabilis TaxID=68239 RepID=UPI00369DF4DF